MESVTPVGRPSDFNAISDGETRWYVAQTRPHYEETACLRLKDQGFTTFLPRMDRTIRHARRVLTVKRPVFPTYCFVQFDPRVTQWRAINGTIGVRHLIMRGERPAPIKTGVVETLMASSGPNGRIQFQDALQPGDRVRLLSGPFANELGVLNDLKEDGRIRILLNFLGGPVMMNVPSSSVVRLTA